MCRDEVSKQIAGFRQQWFGRMHRIDKFFHRVRPPQGARMSTHKGAMPCACNLLQKTLFCCLVVQAACSLPLWPNPEYIS